MLNPARDLCSPWFRWRIAACAAVLLFAVALCCQSTPAQTTAPPHAENAIAKTAAPTPADAKRAKDSYTLGRKAEADKNWREAFADYSEAARALPDNREYAIRRDVARSQLVQAYVDRAERDAVSNRMTEARADLSAAIALDPSDAIARERWNELSIPQTVVKENHDEQLAGLTYLKPAEGTHDFNFKGDVQGAYQEIARQFGVRATFDVDLARRPVHLAVSQVDFNTAMKVLGEMTSTFWRPMATDLFFVAQDTPQKRKDYEPSVTRTILLPASSTQDDLTEMLRAIRDLTGITRTVLDSRARTLTLRATPSAIALASQLVQDLEKPRGQLVLDIEILEVNRQAGQNLGILPPQSSTLYTLSKQEVQTAESGLSGLVSVIQQVFGTPSSLSGLTSSQISGLLSGGQLALGGLIPPLFAFGGGGSTFLGTIPSATANFATMLSTVRNGQHIKLRAEDGHPATFFVGDRVPVSLAQYSNSLGSSTNIPGVSSSGFTTSDLTTGTTPTAIAEGVLQTATGSTTVSAIDLLVTNFADETVSVFLGNGDGTFGAKTDFNTGNGPSAIALADFNGDGKLDVVVANKNDNTVSVLLGNGDGTLASKQDFPVGTTPLSVATGDFNGDGFVDLAVANQADNAVSILLGNGDGTFKPQVTYTTGTAPTAVTVGDFNGDGKLDMAVANQNSATVSVFLGNGDGTFKPRVDYATGNSPVALQTADLNGDTFLDLAVVNEKDDTVSILLGNGDGTFQTQIAYPTTTTPDSITIADFNEDGRPDLAIAEQGSDTVSVLLGLGGGAFSTPLDVPVGSTPSSVVSADFNGDGLPDLAVTNEGANSATIILNSNAVESLLASSVTGGEVGTPYPSVEYLDLGVKLKATPRLHPDNEVTLQLSLEIRSLSGVTLNGLPIITNRTIEHTVRLKENETSALAGILEKQEMNAINGTPGITDMTAIGQLIGDRTSQDTGDELLVLVTPRRINPVERVSHELYAGHPPQQGGGSVGQTFEERQPQPQPEQQPAAAPPEEQPQPPTPPEPEPEPEPAKPQ
ncbi:MAG: FG-GAP-like repeat-containing protein [Candidatus Acidiferrales bacterium]|jgi:hypothetical protein